MSYTVLARRYRSATFDQVVGQEHVAQTLQRAMESGRVAHAYLFCGTRGTGKTSMARILAKSLNCLKSEGPTTHPCLECDSCLAVARGDDIDVIEIDAASNTGVDNVREIIDNSRYRPARSRFKVYIIDEAHMLSKAAFNALLKTLEEPPPHVKFILATTEPEKLPATILSRCQRYDFRNIPLRQVAGRLKDICAQEGLEADDDALLMVARAGAGSMRDAISLLDRLLSSGGRLTSQMIESLLGLPRAQAVFDLAEGISNADVKGTLGAVEAMLAVGLSEESLVAALADHLRNLLIVLTCGAESPLLESPGIPLDVLAKQAGRFDAVTLTQNIAMLEELRRNMRQGSGGRAMLDATLVRLALAGQFASIEQLLDRLETPAGAPAAAAPRKKKKPLSDTRDANFFPSVAAATEGGLRVRAEPINTANQRGYESRPSPQPSVAAASEGERSSPDGNDLVAEPRAAWPKAVAMLSQGSPAMGILKQTRIAEVVDDQVVIEFHPGVASFVETWTANGKRQVIAKTLSDLCRRPIGVRLAAAAPAEIAPAAATTPAEERYHPLVEAVLREFGGRVVAEV